MFAGGRDVVVVLAGQAQLGAVALVHDVPQLFGGQRLKANRSETQTSHHDGDVNQQPPCFPLQHIQILQHLLKQTATLQNQRQTKENSGQVIKMQRLNSFSQFIQ